MNRTHSLPPYFKPLGFLHVLIERLTADAGRPGAQSVGDAPGRDISAMELHLERAVGDADDLRRLRIRQLVTARAVQRRIATVGRLQLRLRRTAAALGDDLAALYEASDALTAAESGAHTEAP